MRCSKVLPFLIVSLILQLTVSCPNPEDEEKGGILPFTANFTNDWLREDAEGFIVLSDTLGQVLAATTWNGNTRIEFDPTPHPRIIVTTGTRNIGSSRINLTTNAYVLPGEWTWKGVPDRSISGYTTLKFINQPTYEFWGAWFAGIDQERRVYNLSYDVRFPVVGEQDYLHFYILPKNDDWLYLLVDDFSVDSTTIVDLSALKRAQHTDIDFHLSTYRCYIDWKGFPTPGEYYQGSIPLPFFGHEGYGDEWFNSFSLAHASELTNYRTEFIHFDGSEYWSGDYWSFYDYGPVPSTTAKINADFEIIGSQPDGFHLEITGAVDNVKSYWRGYGDNAYSIWRVFNHPSFSNFALPQMPDSIIQQFELPEISSYSLAYAEIMDYPDLDSHEEVIETLFQSEDYFFNIATGGVRSRTKQNRGLSKKPADVVMFRDEKSYDPMLPTP